MQNHKWLFRNTAVNKGRNILITNDNSEFKFINAGRIILDTNLPSITAQNKDSETCLLVLSGNGRVIIGENVFDVVKLDGVYVSKGESFIIETDTFIDIVEASAKSNLIFESKLVKFDDVKDNPAMCFDVGNEPYKRKINKIIAENVEGSRLLMGITQSSKGNWTSWPPHEHAKTQEEFLF